MEILKWVFLSVVSLLLGLLYVRFLTSHPLKMSRYLFAATLLLASLVAVLAASFSGIELLIGIPLSMAFGLAGYAAMTRALLSREDDRPLPDLARAKSDSGLGHMAVVCFTHGEP